MCSPRWATDSRFFFMTLTVSSICCEWIVVVSDCALIGMRRTDEVLTEWAAWKTAAAF